ncbi:hypothetical protein JTB14_026754 [Gonioctena quinquepunctata]|nr:hypothetical protein JTB14_026754 [Gonioctena quinquepunctata]
MGSDDFHHEFCFAITTILSRISHYSDIWNFAAARVMKLSHVTNEFITQSISDEFAHDKTFPASNFPGGVCLQSDAFDRVMDFISHQRTHSLYSQSSHYEKSLENINLLHLSVLHMEKRNNFQKSLPDW